MRRFTKVGLDIELRVNGKLQHLEVDARDRLIDVLRDRLGLTGTKEGCGTGECGACTVILDGRPVNSCLVLAVRANGKDVETVEGLGTPHDLHPLQEAFVKYGALQCGFCGSGMLMTAKALLDRNPEPMEDEIRAALAGNLCRCTGYGKIVESVQVAARSMADGREDQ
jgi:carbon-monoxide dehydrogenase small subunit